MVTIKPFSTMTVCCMGLSLALVACDEQSRSGGLGNQQTFDPVECAEGDPDCSCMVEGAMSACRLPSTANGRGELTCTTGTMTCSGGKWSTCGHLTTHARRVPSAAPRALVHPDAALVACDPCDPDCFRVEDPMDGLPVGYDGLALADGGGLTIGYEGDGMVARPDLPMLDSVPCTLGSPPDRDCDAIPDVFDPLPNVPPLKTAHEAVFMDLPPGTAGAQIMQLDVRMKSADFYFYLDMSTDVYSPLGAAYAWDAADNSRPMGAAKNALANAFELGTFLSDTSIDCVDRDGDGLPDNSLKTQGIAGNVACLIPDVRFGAGWFRDIPFGGPYDRGQVVAAGRTFMFGHGIDLTSSASAVAQAVSMFNTSEVVLPPSVTFAGNVPEGSMQGLWALATGQEVYAGWNKAGISARTNCPPQSWGYPCFRDAAMPVVLHVTDAPMQNGPRAPVGTSPLTGRGCLDGYSDATCHPIDYDEAVLSPTASTDALLAAPVPHYRPLSAQAERVVNAEPVGELVGQLVTYTGDTQGMGSDIGMGGVFSCPSGGAWSWSLQGAPDAVFSFEVANPIDVPGSRIPLVFSARGTEFDATLMVVRLDTAGNPAASVACMDDNVDSTWIPELSLTLPNGRYAVVLKGYADAEAGRFQLTLGNPALAVKQPFAAHPWSGPDGVSTALGERGMHVVGLCASESGNCAADNAYTWEQSQLLARATSTLAGDGSPLAVSFDPFGGTLAIGQAIVHAAEVVAADARMDVTLRLVQQPDDPTPDFRLVVEALAPGDGRCDGVFDADADGVPDTHRACRPGARPAFRVTFANPNEPASVPPNPTPRPGNGYMMRLQLVGDGRQVLDEVPVYLMPQAIVPPPPRPLRTEAVYTQTVLPAGCISNEAPRWDSLGWDATLPSDTELLWDLCLADGEAALGTCTYVRVASVHSGAACITNAECTDGYCDASGVCHYVEGPPCTDDPQCGVGGRCVAGSTTSSCRWSQTPVPLQAALLPGMQGLGAARVRMTMRSSPDQTLAPTVNRFNVEYTCSPLQ
jgi:hypothetical protein